MWVAERRLRLRRKLHACCIDVITRSPLRITLAARYRSPVVLSDHGGFLLAAAIDSTSTSR